MQQESGRVCLLTGASGRLGSAFCRRYGARYQIVAVYRRAPPPVPSQHRWFVDPLDTTRKFPANRHPVYEVQADLTEDREVLRVVELVLARFGQIDVIVNAARYSRLAPLVDGARTLKDVEQHLLLNAVVPARLAAHVARAFWRSRDRQNRARNRNVINLSSTAGLFAYPDYRQNGYGASKAALNQLTYHMANEFQSFGVRVNAIAPNTFPGIVPMERVLRAIERIDRGRMNGSILLLDRGREAVVRPHSSFQPRPV